MYGVTSHEGMPREQPPAPARDPVRVFRCLNGTPAQSIEKILAMAGGVEGIVGLDDVVVIKPNGQWWNQGAPNLAALIALVGCIMERPGGFRGEVVLAENCHRGPRPWEALSSAWARAFERNHELSQAGNLGEAAALLKRRFGDRFALRHWVDVKAGGRRVRGPEEGDGYVYCDGTGGVPLLRCDNGIEGPGRRETIMTYPVFTTDRGTRIDFKNGIWDKGTYPGRPLKFINLSALNHHSTYCGMTAAVKNYLGVADLSGGADPHAGGRLTDRYCNFHSFPFDKWAPGPAPGMLGKEIAVFLRTVRRADLNIVTAEWIGLSSRTDPPVARTRAVLASTDPVALDFHAAKYLLYPNSGIRLHDPENERGPLNRYLRACSKEGGGIIDEAAVSVVTYDFSAAGTEIGRGRPVSGEILWGVGTPAWLRYLALRHFVR